MSDSIQEQIETARTLVGDSIVRWDAIEMAARQDPHGGRHQFTDPAAPCIQASMLAIIPGDGRPAVVSHYQGDAMFGFWVKRSPVPFKDWEGTDGGSVAAHWTNYRLAR